MANHTVAIVIPTFNRLRSLVRCLRKCEMLDPASSEIIVVDDASTDGTKRVIKKEFPSITYIRLPSNRGQAYVRSVGMATASADLIVSLDDDAWFEETDALSRLLIYASEFDHVGVFMFAINTPGGKDARARRVPTYIANHITCGCAYRASALESVGYHLEFIHSGAEETDITLKMLDAGYMILHTPDIQVFHDFEPSSRPPDWHASVRRNTFRNDLIQVVVRYPIEWVAPALGHKIISHLRFGLQHGLVGPSLGALYDFLIALPVALRHRKSISRRALMQYSKLKQNPCIARETRAQI